MLNISCNTKIFLCMKAISMRNSFEGLGREVEALFPGELLSGSLFIFINRMKDQIKVLFWDRDGFVIWQKRLEKGTFSTKNLSYRLDRKSFLMLLEGVTPKKIQHRFSLEKE